MDCGNCKKVKRLSLAFFVFAFFAGVGFSVFSIAIDYPADGHAYNATTWLGTLNYTATGFSQSNLVSNGGEIYCKYSVDSGSNISIYSCNNVSLSSLADGSHTITIYLMNISEGLVPKADDTIEFELERTIPVVTITSPAAGSYHDAAAIDIEFTYVEVNKDSCWWTLDGSAPIYNDITCAGGSGTVTGTWPEGEHTIVVYMNDTFGNIGYDSVTFTVDLTDPVVTVTTPDEDDLWFTNKYMNVSFTVVDMNLDKCWWTNDSGAHNYNISCTGGSGNVSPSDSWPQGLNTVTVYANDSSGRVGSATRTFYVDSVAPDVTITSPAAGSYHDAAAIDIEFTYVEVNKDSC